jgi:hypothetical protein
MITEPSACQHVRTPTNELFTIQGPYNKIDGASVLRAVIVSQRVKRNQDSRQSIKRREP